MALSDLTANSRSSVNWYAARSNGEVFNESTFRDAYDVIQAFTFGEGSRQVNQMFVDQRTVSLATPTDDLDLSGSLLNVFGETITFDSIKEILIYNMATTTGEDLAVGGKSPDGFNQPFGGSSNATVPVAAGGKIQMTAPLAGYPVVASATDVLRIVHDGSVGDISYVIIILGVDS